MTVREQVLKARTPQEALLVLADAIDNLNKEPSFDSWDGWNDPETHKQVNAQFAEASVKPKAAFAEYARIKEELAETSDPEESQALQAKLNLLKDELKPPAHYADEEQQASKLVTDENGNVVVELPPPTEEHMELRREFAEKRLKLQDEFGPEILESYVKGGPLVIYYTDRDFVMRLPDEFKRVMVDDVQNFSPREAKEMARDILKDVTADGGRDVTMEALTRGR